MDVVVGALCFGVAAALVVSTFRRVSSERRVRNHALEQIGLRERQVVVERGSSMDRHRVMVLSAGAIIAIGGVVVIGPLGLLLGAAPVVIDRMITNRAAARRSKELASALPGALQLLVDNLRVGRDLVTSLSEVAANSDEPVASIFATVVAEVRLGARVDAAFEAASQSEGDRHLGIVASAIGLNVEFGGNLVEILGSVIESLEEEDRLRRDIDSLTADGRLSSTVLLILPVITLIVVSVLSPGYAAPLIEQPAGRMMSIVGVILGVAGWAWLRALSNPEVTA